MHFRTFQVPDEEHASDAGTPPHIPLIAGTSARSFYGGGPQGYRRLGPMRDTGIIDLGESHPDFVAVPAAAEDGRRAAAALTDRNEIDYVVSSQWHTNHVRGNLMFPDAVIAAAHRTREVIIAHTGTPEVERQAIKAGIR